jgi:orotidine-5'-phosphate decarboxylase
MNGPTSAASNSSPRPAVAEPGVDFLARLDARVAAVGSCLCLGVDPDPAGLPPGFSADAAGIESFARLLIDAAAPCAAAVKINVAFFEAFGSAGIAALERLRSAVPAELPLIADAKRADIANTAARQAVALFDALGADAVTVNPYLGRDALAPFLERHDRLVYVLCRTSNPGAAELQNQPLADGEPLYLHVARRALEWAGAGANVGLVVGATAPGEMRRIRSAAPGLPFLVPGIGAQGGDVDAVLADGAATMPPGGNVRGGGLLVNVSRGISQAAMHDADPAGAIEGAARDWMARLRC